MERHPTFKVSDFKDISYCGKIIGHQLTGSVYELPFEVQPTEGEHDYRTCPNCKEHHRIAMNQVKELLDQFPDCCDNHRKLNFLKEFNKNDFENTPKIIADKIVFTNQHIINHIPKETWYEDITHYIEWVIESFGSFYQDYGPPFCLGGYMERIKKFIEANEGIDLEKQEKLIGFLDSYYVVTEIDSDFILLIEKYEKWVKAFPFEIEYFKDIHENFKKNLPFLKGKPVTNKYSGITKAQLTSTSELVESLFGITHSLLTKIDSDQLVKDEKISDKQRHMIELVIKEHRLKQDSLFDTYTKSEMKYVKLLRRWLINEKEFFRELKTISQNKDLEKQKSFKSNLYSKFKEHGFLDLDKVVNLSPGGRVKLFELIVENQLPYWKFRTN